MDVNAIIDAVVTREGTVYVNHPRDRGGPTRYGITQTTLEKWRGHPVSSDELRCLGLPEAKAIYRARYVEGPGFADLTTDQGLLGALVDFAVHSGPKSAILALQKAIGVVPDGLLGPKTRQALAVLPPREVVWRLLIVRAELLCCIVRRDPSQRPFFRGWLTRVLDQVPHDAAPDHPPTA